MVSNHSMEDSSMGHRAMVNSFWWIWTARIFGTADNNDNYNKDNAIDNSNHHALLYAALIIYLCTAEKELVS